MGQKGTKAAKAVKGDTGERSHEGKNGSGSGKEKGLEENGYPEDDMIQLDIDMVQLVEDTETIEELK